MNWKKRKKIFVSVLLVILIISFFTYLLILNYYQYPEEFYLFNDYKADSPVRSTENAVIEFNKFIMLIKQGFEEGKIFPYYIPEFDLPEVKIEHLVLRKIVTSNNVDKLTIEAWVLGDTIALDKEGNFWIKISYDILI